MSSFSRWWHRLTDRGFFALGLTVGIASLVLALLALEHSSPIISPLSQEDSNSREDAYKTEYEQRTKPDIFFWPRKFLALEDSLAQWLMMGFTVAAFWVLLRTLKVTREVGKAQVVAYLGLKIGDITIRQLEGGKTSVSIHAHLENSGNSPAFNARVGYNIIYVKPNEVTEVIYDIDRIGHVGNPHPVVPPKSEGQGATLSRTMDKTSDAVIRFMYMIQFDDVFNDTNHTPIFSGTLMEHPESSGRFVFSMDSVTIENPAEQKS